jgi:hypothetical protein
MKECRIALVPRSNGLFLSICLDATLPYHVGAVTGPQLSLLCGASTDSLPNIFGRCVVAIVLARQPRDMGSPRQSREGNIMCGRALRRFDDLPPQTWHSLTGFQALLSPVIQGCFRHAGCVRWLN